MNTNNIVKGIIFLLILIISINAFSISFTVKQDGTGDFTNILDAVLAAYNYQNENATIIVYPGIYEPLLIAASNPNHSVLIVGTDKNNCIIDGNHNNLPIQTMIDTLTSVTLKNFIIKNGKPTGILIGDFDINSNTIYPSSGNFIIDNCDIIDNGQYSNYNDLNLGQHGAGIRCFGNLTLINSNINYNIANYDDWTEERLGGGLYVNNLENYYCTINNCNFNKNISGGGGAIYATGAGNIEIDNCFFGKDSLYSDFEVGHENGIVGLFQDFTGNINMKKNILRNNYYYQNDGTIGMPIVVFNNCPNVSFINNDIINVPIQTNFSLGIAFNSSTSINIENNIFSGLFSDIYGSGSNYNVNYNYIPLGTSYTNTNLDIGEGNIEYGSMLLNIDTYQPIWDSTGKSVLIDSGNPAFFDADGTPIDIGAKPITYQHDFFTQKIPPNRVKWVSFPVIDLDIVPDGPKTRYICSSVPSQTDNFYIKNINNGITYDNYSENHWNNDHTNILDSLYSNLGYFVKTSSYTEISVSGTKLPDNTVINLEEGDNYRGYFIKEPMTINDAFSDIWDHLVAVYGEDWAWVKNGSYPPERSVLIYGKMYNIVVDENCSFQYQLGSPVTPKERTMTDGFSYTETESYVPINIESLDDPSILEVGVFSNGVCIGASKVEDYPVQILAFPTSGKNNQDINFQFYYGRKSYKTINDYSVIDGINPNKISLTPFKTQTIKFTSKTNYSEKITIWNYPNPFNPITSIFFSLPKEANVQLNIYNIKGQKVKSLINGNLKAGKHEVVWQGINDNNNSVSSGIYFYKINSCEKSIIGKMILLK